MKSLILICVTAVCSLGTSLLAQQQNVALGRPVMASAPTWPGQPPGNLTDGDVVTMSHPQAKNGTGGFYYEIDLGKEYDLEEIVVFNRSNCCPERLTRYRISIHPADDTNRKTPNWSTILRADGTNSGKGGRDNVDAKLDPQGKFSGRFIRIINTSGAEYNPQVAEVEAWMDSGERSGGVTLHPAHGFFDEPFDLKMTAEQPGAEIRFTTDGKAPTLTTGQVYAGPVTISTTAVIRAAAFEEGKAGSRVVTQSYLFPDQVISNSVMDMGITKHPSYGPKMRSSLASLPTMVISTGIPINGNSETFGSVEFIPANGDTGFQVNAGIRNFGGAFTNFAKKNFRIYFRKKFGVSKLQYPLFEGFSHGIEAATEFDRLNLRTGSHDMVSRGFYMSNRFTDDTMLEMGNLNPHGRFVHLYLDGTYWGMYHLRERWCADTLAEYLGGQPEEYEAINGNWNVGGWAEPGDPYDGDGSAWTRIKSLRGDYEKIQAYLDVPNYIDYMLLFMFGNSEAEYRCAGPVGEGSGFKFFLNDADGWLRTSAGNRTARGSPGRKAGDGPGSIFSMLHMEGHPDYRVLLADRIHNHLFNDGALTPDRNAARLRARVNEMGMAFLSEAARWNYRSPNSWTLAKDNILNDWFPSRTATVISHLKSAGFYPATDAPVLTRHGGQIEAGFELKLSAQGGTIIFYTTDGSDPRLKGGGISPSATVASTNTVSLPIQKNTQIIARARSGNGEWSALTDAFFWIKVPVAAGDIVISELHYHPSDDGQLEFLELQNVSGQAINLRGARFISGILYTFSETQDTILQPSGRLVLARSQFDMQKAHGLGLVIGGVYQGGLSNSGEELVLADSNTNNLVKLYYEDRAPWPEAADGQGPSLVFHGSIAGFNDPRTWRLGQMEGTPGTGEGKRYLANPSLDSDGNGQSDLLDYALGQDANGQTNFPVFKIDPSNGEVTADLRGTYTVWQNLAAEDLSFSLEYSLDLRNWQTITNQLDVGETKFLDTGFLERNWHKRISSDTDPVNFFRLRIEDR